MRRQIFERVLNYLCYTSPTQIKPLSDFELENRDCVFLFQPTYESHYSLEFSDSKGTHTFQRYKVFSGSFTDKQLNLLLKPNLKEKIFCLVHSYISNHSIRIGKKDDEFILYDPNYSHNALNGWPNLGGDFDLLCLEKSAPIYKKFSTLDELIKELQSIQGMTLIVEFAV